MDRNMEPSLHIKTYAAREKMAPPFQSRIYVSNTTSVLTMKPSIRSAPPSSALTRRLVLVSMTSIASLHVRNGSNLFLKMTPNIWSKSMCSTAPMAHISTIECVLAEREAKPHHIHQLLVIKWKDVKRQSKVCVSRNKTGTTTRTPTSCLLAYCHQYTFSKNSSRV